MKKHWWDDEAKQAYEDLLIISISLPGDPIEVDGEYCHDNKLTQAALLIEEMDTQIALADNALHYECD